MFTIKQVVRGKDGARQDDTIRLFEGRMPHREISATTGKAQVGFTMDDGIYCTIDTGVVFVMNAQGKTVETFRLEGSDWF